MATNNAINATLPVFDKMNTQRINLTGAFSYTPTSGTQFAVFELQGAGGGSGGAAGQAGQGGVGAGGGGGAYQKILITGAANLAAITGSVGLGGTAGTAGNNAGAAGGNTTLTINSGTQWVAGGGAGGAGAASSANAQAGGLTLGGANTFGTNGTLVFALTGGTSSLGFISAAAALPFQGSTGGNSFLSPLSAGTTTAVQGFIFGGGACGAANNSLANIAGAAGGSGVVIVTEYISV
jgi:hypothetical protein